MPRFEWLNITNKQNDTSLHIAVRTKNKKVIINLLNCGVGCNITNQFGRTPLIIAILYRCDIEIIKLLLKYGADPLIKDNKGINALGYAILKNYNEYIDIMNEYQSHNTISIKRIILLDAIDNNDLNTINICINNYPEIINIVDEFGNTSLHYAVLSNKPDIVALLIHNGADIQLFNNMNETVFDIALKNKSYDIITILNDFENGKDFYNIII